MKVSSKIFGRDVTIIIFWLDKNNFFDSICNIFIDLFEPYINMHMKIFQKFSSQIEAWTLEACHMGVMVTETTSSTWVSRW